MVDAVNLATHSTGVDPSGWRYTRIVTLVASIRRRAEQQDQPPAGGGPPGIG